MLILRASSLVCGSLCGCKVWGDEEEADFFRNNLEDVQYLPKEPGWARCVFKGGKEGPLFNYYRGELNYCDILPNDWA